MTVRDAVRCLVADCDAVLPADELGVYERARAAGWSRIYGGPDGTGFRCPAHRGRRSSARSSLIAVLRSHEATLGGCMCGWEGTDHPAHVVDEYVGGGG